MNHQYRDPIRAAALEEIPDAFEAEPLASQKAMDLFYVDTIPARVGDGAPSPIWRIEKACRRPSDRNAWLLLGHRGCGKSTELNHMKLRMEKQGRPVGTVQCGLDLYLENLPYYSDLLILMADALITLADEYGVTVRPRALETIRDFWDEGTETRTLSDEKGVETQGGFEASAPLLKAVLKAFVNVKGNLKYNDEVRTKYERKLTGNFREWQSALNQISDDIGAVTGKQPLLIFEDLDKLEPKAAGSVFFLHAQKLSSFSFPVIYTFPIALCYDAGFSAVDSFFNVETFPMMELRDRDGNPVPEGYKAVWEIIEKRMAPGIVDEDALKLMIDMTGGSLRNLFEALRDASEDAEYRGAETVELSDAKHALVRLKSKLTRRIQGAEHEFLYKIYRNQDKNREKITDRQTLLRMLQAGTLLEYDGDRWYNVHPLVAEFLEYLNENGQLDEK